MKILGINIGETREGIHLQDGGAALVVDGKISVAIAEERITRKKYDGGFINSVKYCLNSSGLKLKDIDFFVFSNCCDLSLDYKFLNKVLKKNKLFIPLNKIIINPSHHMAHACSTFFASPFDKALLVVVDNEGNILKKKYKSYWKNSLERTSVYIAEGNKVELLFRMHDGFNELGIGAAYNYFTKWLGFRSYQDASKTMGLASYGGSRFKFVKIFDKEGKCLLKSIHNDKARSVRELIFDQSGMDIGLRCESVEDPSALQKDIAYLTQTETEKAVISIIQKAIAKTGIKNICLAGGVALNCVMNYKIIDQLGVNLFVQPAAGDTGQCLGDAFYGYYISKNGKNRFPYLNSYLGKSYSFDDISSALKKYSAKITYVKQNNLSKKVAQLLSEGNVIGWFSGKSEFGPRALGNRSILADPRNASMKDTLNLKVKFREPFRPYAPIVLEEEYGSYFDLDLPSPFMLLAPSVLAKMRDKIPAVTHVDGTSRVQTINSTQNKKIYSLIKEFKKLTSVPVILNTSFNIAGEPIVETPDDAIRCFLNTNIDYLIVEDYIIQKCKK